MAYDAPDIEEAATTSRGNQLQHAFNLVCERWMLILLLMVLCSLGGGLIGWYRAANAPFRQTWEAHTELRVEHTPYDKEIFHELGGDSLFRNSPESLVRRITVREIATDIARALVQQDIADIKLDGFIATEEEYHERGEYIASKLNVKANDSAGTITITSQGRCADDARRFTEYAARALITRNQQYLLHEEQEAYEFAQSELQKVSAELDAAVVAEWEFRREMGFLRYDQFDTDMRTWNEELNNNHASREGMLRRLGDIEKELKENNEKLPFALGQIGDTVVRGLLNDLDELLQKQFEMEVAFQPGYEPLEELKYDIHEKQQAIFAAISKLDEGMDTGQSVWDRRQTLRAEYMRLQVDLATLELRSATLEKLISETVEHWSELTDRHKEYEQLKRNVQQYREQFNKWIDTRAQVEQAIRRGAAPVARSNPASAPELLKGSPKQRVWMAFLLGAGIGLLAGVGFAVLAEMMDTSIKRVEDVTEYIGLEVIGTIPRMRFRKPKGRRARGNYVAIKDEHEVDSCIVTQHDPKSPISEAYRTLRTNFQFATIQQKPKTVMVTSGVPGEGKTTTAVNMAVTFADSGFRVLIVDIDLRRPHVHHVLKMSRGPGLADVLTEGLDYRTLTRPTRVRNLWSISSGHVPPNPSELIGSARMAEVIEGMKKQFDLIIFDAPSILVVTDPVLLSTQVDSVVLVVSAQYVRRETIIRAKKLLSTAQANIAGVVLNGLEATRRHYYYYYYYYDEHAVGRLG